MKRHISTAQSHERTMSTRFSLQLSGLVKAVNPGFQPLLGVWNCERFLLPLSWTWWVRLNKKCATPAFVLVFSWSSSGAALKSPVGDWWYVDALATPKNKAKGQGAMWRVAVVGFRMKSNTEGGCGWKRWVARRKASARRVARREASERRVARPNASSRVRTRRKTKLREDLWDEKRVQEREWDGKTGPRGVSRPNESARSIEREEDRKTGPRTKTGGKWVPRG